MEPPKPDTFVDTCTACGTSEPADAKGLCPNPVCRCMRKGAKLAAKFGPVNTARRKELRQQLEYDYRPVSTIDKSRCRLLANICERLEVAKSGTQEQQRMIQSQGILVEALSASLATRRAAVMATGRLELETMTDEQIEIRGQAIEKVMRYLRQQAPVERLSLGGLIQEVERLLVSLRDMQAKGCSTQQRQVSEASIEQQQPSDDDSEVEDEDSEDEDLIEDPEALQARIAREEQDLAQMKQQLADEQQLPTAAKCQWCYQTPCIGRQHPHFDVLHPNDPEVVRQRDEQATAEMHESMRRRRRGEY